MDSYANRALSSADELRRWLSRKESQLPRIALSAQSLSQLLFRSVMLLMCSPPTCLIVVSPHILPALFSWTDICDARGAG